MNNAPICWFSKKQNTVETSTFGSELVALRTAVEKVKALRIKLRYMGIELGGPTVVYCDNQSVTKSTTNVEARLSRKHQSICWHAVREAQAAGWIRIGWIKSTSNIADVFTKALAMELKRLLLRNIFAPKGG